MDKGANYWHYSTVMNDFMTYQKTTIAPQPRSFPLVLQIFGPNAIRSRRLETKKCAVDIQVCLLMFGLPFVGKQVGVCVSEHYVKKKLASGNKGSENRKNP